MPRAGRHGRATAANMPLAYIMLMLLVIIIVGWLELRRFEAHLAERAAKEWEAELAQHEEQGYPSFKTAMQSGPQSSSAMCAALLEAAGILPDAQGQRIGVQSEQGREGAAGADAEGGTAGSTAGTAGSAGSAGSAAAVRYLHSRRQLYDAMEAALLERGLALDASSTQGMGLGDMFRRGEDGQLQPLLKELEVPVRAVVLPLADAQAARMLEAAVRTHLLPLLPPGGLWQQDPRVYHSTIYHASTHLDPVLASPAQVDAEEAAIRAVGTAACPLHVVLERIVVTPGGAVLACWQVAGGTEVAELRRQLATALPGASSKQVVSDEAILHTTLARIVTPPRLEGSGSGGSKPQGQQGQGQQAAADAAATAAAEEAAVLLKAAVDQMTQELCGLQAELPELWFAEEYHKLALALGGRFSKRTVPLQCAGQAQHDAAAEGEAGLAKERRGQA